MLSVALGPLALPLAPLWWLACVAAAAWLAGRLAARQPGAPAPASTAAPTAAAAEPADRAQARARQVLWRAAWASLLGARIAYVALHADLYAAAATGPGGGWGLLGMLDLRDGGWHPGAGMLAGLGALALWSAPRQAPPARRRAQVLAAMLGLVVWGTGRLLWLSPQTLPLPALPMPALADGRSQILPQWAAGRPAVVNLWATWCGPCRREMPVLAAAERRHPDVAFLYVNQGEAADTVRRFLQGQQLALGTVLLDGAGRLALAVGSASLPTTLFYDRQGRLVDAHVGALSDGALAARIQALRATGDARPP